MSRAKFPVYWRFDGTTQATVVIDRGAGVFSVRPHRRRRTYELPLAFVAQLVATRIIKAEAAEKLLARRRAKKGGR